MEQKWLTWAKEIQAIAQTGLTYAKDVYDIERYQALRELSVDILANYTFESKERIRLSFASEGGYATPKVDIRGVVFREDQILLVREKLDGKCIMCISFLFVQNYRRRGKARCRDKRGLFFAENELPEFSEERNTTEQIMLMFDYLRNPEKVVILD